MVEKARVLTNFYVEYSKEMELVCPSCGWIGHAKDAESEEHKDLFDVSCPKCSKMLLVVPYPTFEQTREAAAAGNPRESELSAFDPADISARGKRAAKPDAGVHWPGFASGPSTPDL